MSKVSNCTHYWIIDSQNVGCCRYCPEVRDFGRLLQREGVYVAAGRRGAEARKEALGKKRGRKKKKLKGEVVEMSQKGPSPQYI